MADEKPTIAPTIAQCAPYIMEMEAGEYWWCKCGRSENQPFCDGSHHGSSFEPVKVTLERPGKVAWCGCKHSQKGTGERCDGTHKSLPAE